ncbi:Similar to conserved hypothetical protein [Ajellomyces capsulatus G186AR]; acc. no. EEH05364 [Pyronema omphalodes CBS 100304]|uniref:Uncharacterized protein n=1 Tax=Pyronema omphalodes (strain CBS 100304) TaxID=1076935 RepID=U4L6N6_PYROM|nr:Similar to conserved hypothetical protein [Ajellomyces capsulatus G186AR]; acc. no. EEH05364 [Pyronema omphalodes CBS 100304]
MSGHVQPATSSWTCLLPRFIPAPQSFLTTKRPYRLPTNNNVKGVVGIKSGNFVHKLNFFPNLIHGIDGMDRFAVRSINIKRSETGRKYYHDVGPKKCGPVNLLAVLGMVFALGLLMESIVVEDGMAVIATVCLAVTSSVIGLASRWEVDLQKRLVKREVPPGDVVVIGRQGAFVIVRCDENISRELYFGTERCKYLVPAKWFQILDATGTFLFMTSVVFVANCTWALQASIGLIYIVLNGLYWAASLIPDKLHWDISGYAVEIEENSLYNTFTSALIEAIRQTDATRWVKQGKVMPDTNAWDRWLEEAKDGVHNKNWDGEEALTRIMNEEKEKMKEVEAQAAQRKTARVLTTVQEL